MNPSLQTLINIAILAVAWFLLIRSHRILEQSKKHTKDFKDKSETEHLNEVRESMNINWDHASNPAYVIHELRQRGFFFHTVEASTLTKEQLEAAKLFNWDFWTPYEKDPAIPGDYKAIPREAWGVPELRNWYRDMERFRRSVRHPAKRPTKVPRKPPKPVLKRRMGRPPMTIHLFEGDRF